MHVLGKDYKKYNPYAVCIFRVKKSPSNKSSKGSSSKTSSLKTCLYTYKFEDYKTEELRGYAIYKKIYDESVINKLKRSKLIDLLYKYVIVSKKMEVWKVYLKEFRLSHPQLDYKSAMKLASQSYRSEKEEMLRTLVKS
jgi:hypothetical protein